MHLILITAMTLSGTPDPRSLLEKSNRAAAEGRVAEAADLLEQVAAGYRRDGYLLKAVAVLKQAVRVDPPRIEAVAQLGDLFQELNLPEDAAEKYRMVIEHHRKLGTSNSASAKHAAEQLAALAQLARSAPPAESKANLLVKEGEVFLKYGLPEKADESFKAALALEPGHAGALEGLKTTARLREKK